MRVLIWPFRTIAETFDGSSVTRRPSTNAVSDTKSFGSSRGLRTAAMHQHDPDADLVQDGDLFDQRAGRSGSANTSPPALTTKILRLYRRI